MNRLSWAILTVASVAAVAVILHLNRGTTFYFDELIWFSDLARLSGLDAILHPHNSHLIGTTRGVYLLVANVFGPDYVVFRVLAVSTVVLCAFLFFAVAKRRVGPLLALPLAILLLLYGSAWQHIAGPIGFTVLLSAAAGLAALLALDREDRRGDAWACAFLVFSIFTYTVGIPFLVGVAILVLLRPDRLRRAWIFLVPLVLYGAWWLWASQFDQGREQLSNVDRVASFFAESAANIVGGVSGVNGVLDGRPNVLGWILAAIFVAALIWRISRGNVPHSLWASLGILLTYWLAAALSDDSTTQGVADPAAVRLVYPATIGILLVATDAARGVRPGKWLIAAVVAVGVFSLAMNVKLLRDGAEFLRGYGAAERVDLAMLELANGVLPGGDGSAEETGARDVLPDDISYLLFGPDPDLYMRAVTTYGSPAPTLDVVRLGSPEFADKALADTYGIEPVPAPPPGSLKACTRSEGEPVALDPGGAVVRAEGGGAIALSRFGAPPGAEVGTLADGAWSRIEIPTDPADEPWSISAPVALTVCPL